MVARPVTGARRGEQRNSLNTKVIDNKSSESARRAAVVNLRKAFCALDFATPPKYHGETAIHSADTAFSYACTQRFLSAATLEMHQQRHRKLTGHE
ncbi:hypothetical protein [Mycobacterium sp. E2497]|uniref:hypothetical protein n=2 Tax=unclassified Mycobacterium TaxID=2642494 RepID=UPI001156E677|nr:hypothetical protein [Mycobacterium sp. E2497]